MMNENNIRLGVVGCGQRGEVFVKAARHVESVRLVALCDSEESRLRNFRDMFSLGSEIALHTELGDFLQEVDAVVVCSPDTTHRDVAVASLQAGRHLLLEKPMALNAMDCRGIVDAAKTSRGVAQLGFVLRSTRFYRTVKEIIDSGVLGQVMSIQASEFLNVMHGAAYMRRWHRKSANAHSLLLAKSSHDLDLICWFAGAYPVRVASFGGSDFFMPEKQPATHCSKCPEREGCPYAFDGMYVTMTPEAAADPSRFGYDLCVYNADKDVADNQVCIFEFENRIRATFQLQMFYPGPSTRKLLIAGTGGYLEGCMETGELELRRSTDGSIEKIDASPDNTSGHGGGDIRILEDFLAAIRCGGDPAADLAAGLAATVIAEAVERARREGSVVGISQEEFEI
jgi:predicted dehydrogenase